MKTTTTKIYIDFIRKWPDATSISGDYEYWMPTRKELEEALKASPIDLKQYISEAGDCDKFALILHGQIVLMRWGLVLAKVADNNYPWAFGQVEGHFQRYLDKGIKGNHRINFCMTSDEGLLWIEPQTDEIWKPEENDKIAVAIF